jgi:hypothetical protein
MPETKVLSKEKKKLKKEREKVYFINDLITKKENHIDFLGKEGTGCRKEGH